MSFRCVPRPSGALTRSFRPRVIKPRRAYTDLYEHDIEEFTDTVLHEGKAIPVTGRGGPYGCETSRLPDFLDNLLTDGGKVVSLTRRTHLYPPGRFLILISVRC
jgi:hypothetical protein